MLRKIVRWIALTLWQGMFFGLWVLCGQELAIRIIPRVIEEIADRMTMRVMLYFCL